MPFFYKNKIVHSWWRMVNCFCEILNGNLTTYKIQLDFTRNAKFMENSVAKTLKIKSKSPKGHSKLPQFIFMKPLKFAQVRNAEISSWIE